MAYFLYPAVRGLSLAWLLAFTKSFAWLVCRIVGLFTPRERGQTNYAQTSQANDFVNTKSHARGLFTEPSNVVGELQVIVSMR